MSDLTELFQRHNLAAILEQKQKVNELCPVAGINPEFSPERIARLAGRAPEELLHSSLIWECLTCGLCRQASGGRADMSAFIRELRCQAAGGGLGGPAETHGGLLLSAQRIQARGRFGAGGRGRFGPAAGAWDEDGLQVRHGKGEVLYWSGAARFLAAALPDLQPTALESARAAIRLLNHLGITPVLPEQERFSGHDLLWSGDLEGFRSLAARNLQAIRESGARTVVVSSPEDCYTLKVSYPELVEGSGAEVRHLSELLAERLSELRFREFPHRVSYHDPCRLGRGLGLYQAPRQVLQAVPGLELVEMEHSRELAWCCGTSGWTNCSRYSKLMQVRRLQEAEAAGAELLVTPCWECALHFRCATRAEAWRQVELPVRDWAELLAGLLEENR